MFPLRDIAVTLFAFGSLPYIFKDPYMGVLVWNIFAFLSPHRYTWSFAYNFRFSLIIAAATIISFLMYNGRKQVPWCSVTVFMLILTIWVSITTVLAINPSGAVSELNRFSKIILLIFIALALIDNREKIDKLVWVICVSLGFYGFKGGLFTIAHGGIYRVGGPTGSFIEGNNELAFALIICLPLMRYLHLNAKKRFVKNGLITVMVLCVISIIGSYSRGAFLAGGAMLIFLWLRSRKRFGLLLAIVILIPIMFSFMPEEWHSRMNTIEDYKEDASAMGRINAWYCAWNLAKDSPIYGGGARAFTFKTFYKYAPDPNNFHDVHSIYFEMLGEQGFVGLFLFLSIYTFSFIYGYQIRRMTRGSPSYQWAFDLASMCQVSLIGYAIGGAFLGLSYWDLPYTIVAIVVLTKAVIINEAFKSQIGNRNVPHKTALSAPSGNK